MMMIMVKDSLWRYAFKYVYLQTHKHIYKQQSIRLGSVFSATLPCLLHRLFFICWELICIHASCSPDKLYTKTSVDDHDHHDYDHLHYFTVLIPHFDWLVKWLFASLGRLLTKLYAAYVHLRSYYKSWELWLELHFFSVCDIWL